MNWKVISRCLALGLLWGAVSAARAADRISFDFQIRPILSDKCYKCHGPDAETREAHLRLDTREGPFSVHDGRTIIAPGDSRASELVRRITSTDPKVRMPPPDSGKKLTREQIEQIRLWVDQGANWERHWSLVAPVRPPLPPVRNEAWCRNPIDRFVLARIEAAGREPSEAARKEILLRRVTLDLTGLPPTLAELDAFVNDGRPDAWERVVDRLLASPRYGERMAVPWLDLARYADTHGYQVDRYRAMWPYRDWVIRAFNANMPYDRFATWQLAGDLLPHATKQQRLATAFNRLHMQNEEGGIVAEEYRVAYVVDRVDTFGTAFLGLTFECSRCHDHKFDPITQKDFYSLFAFFQNIDESGQTSYFTDAMPVPTLLLTDDATDRKLQTIRAKIAERMCDQASLTTAQAGAFETWLTNKGPAPALAGEIARFELGDVRNDRVVNKVNPAKSGRAVENPKIVDGAARLNGENGFDFPRLGTFSRMDPFSFSIRLKASVFAPSMVVLHHSKAPVDAGWRGWELLLENGGIAFGLHHMWPGNSLKVVSKKTIPLNRTTTVAVTYDGSGRASGIHLYIDGAPVDFEIVRDGLYKDITYALDGGDEPDLQLGYRFRDSGFHGGSVSELRLFDRELSPLEAAELAGRDDLTVAWNTPADRLSPDRREALFEYFLLNVSEPARAIRAELHSLRKAENDLVNPAPEVMVMQELPHPKPAYILRRGAYDAREREVFADTPAALPPLPAGVPHNRLTLARWLFAADNPLAARVEVNRLWQQMFGRGLVETSDNFGSQGSPPTDPALLDWLAVEFRESGWDIRHMLRLIANSTTYRQSSRASPDLIQADPDNRLLARGPSVRLSAEMLRDQALLDGGLLVERLGGPSVKPYQPAGVWDVAMGHPVYEQGHGDDLHRRSLYTYWKRSVPPPAMSAFDAPDRNYCVARRQSTATPLQALALLNDVQITEAARFISQRAILEGGSTADARLRWMFRLILDRPATEAEMSILRRMFAEQRELFAADPASAEKLLHVGETRGDPSLDPLDLAAGTAVAEALLNHDGAIMLR